MTRRQTIRWEKGDQSALVGIAIQNALIELKAPIYIYIKKVFGRPEGERLCWVFPDAEVELDKRNFPQLAAVHYLDFETKDPKTGKWIRSLPPKPAFRQLLKMREIWRFPRRDAQG